MEFVDPRPRTAVEPDAYSLAAPLTEGAVIGLMANGFPDSDTFLTHVEAAVARRAEGVEFHRWNKGNASRLASPDELDALAARCDAVIGAYGH